MKSCLTTILLLTSFLSLGQKSDCKANFLYIKNFIEHNSASFADNVTSKTKWKYEKFCDSLLQQTDSSAEDNCIDYISAYLKFFRDNHLEVSKKKKIIDEKDEQGVQQFYQTPAFKNSECLDLDSYKIAELYKSPKNTIEGIYTENANDNYKVAVVKMGDANLYKGIILETKTPLWKKGQVKFEFTLRANNEFTGVLYDRYHEAMRKTGNFENGNASGLDYRKSDLPKVTVPEYDFKLLNDSTAYLCLRSFRGGLFTRLDSFYRENIPVIKTKPFLIIDIRENGGGSDERYRALRPLFYTNPIKSDIVDVFVTKENIKVYEDNWRMMIKDAENYGADAIKEQEREVRIMKNARLNTFVNIEPQQYLRMKSVLDKPRRIALLFNGNTASSAEDLIFDALQSEKVITLGENSGGYTGYGNEFSIGIPQSDFMLSYTTTRYRKQIEFDGIGFTPMIKVDKDQDILKIAMEQLLHATSAGKRQRKR